jgi:hypothetical protein
MWWHDHGRENGFQICGTIHLSAMRQRRTVYRRGRNELILILFTTTAPHPLTEELSRHGQVYEALAISEVLALVEQHLTASIVITPDVEQARARVIQQHYPTVRLHSQFRLTGVSLN